MNPPLSDEERRARATAVRKAWWDANPDYYADEKHLEQRRATNRESMRRRAAADKRRSAEVERVGEWSKKNPEKRQAARDRFKEQNPEKYRTSQREYYQRNKEVIKARRDLRQAQAPEKLREARRRNNATARRKNATGQWRPSEEQREKYAAQSRDTKRLERRLKRAGLPSRRVQRTPAAVRRANLADAEKFFSRQRSRDEVRRITAGDFAEGRVTPAMMQAWTDYLRHQRARRRFGPAVRSYIAKHGKRLRDEVSLDSRARQLLGKPPLNADIEIWRRAAEAVQSTRVTVAPTPAGQSVGERVPSTDSMALAEKVRLFTNLDRPLRGSDLAHPPSAAGKTRGSTSAHTSRETGLGR